VDRCDVYVVDNLSTDESLSLLPYPQSDRLIIIRTSANLGFATSCNIGLARAVSDNLLLLNPDCQVMEGAIDRLLTVLRSTDRVGMVRSVSGQHRRLGTGRRAAQVANATARSWTDH
jgi:GT2 family glycosyltransferase